MASNMVDIARHVMGCHLTQATRVQRSALGDVTSNIRQALEAGGVRRGAEQPGLRVAGGEARGGRVPAPAQDGALGHQRGMALQSSYHFSHRTAHLTLTSLTALTALIALRTWPSPLSLVSSHCAIALTAILLKALRLS